MKTRKPSNRGARHERELSAEEKRLAQMEAAERAAAHAGKRDDDGGSDEKKSGTEDSDDDRDDDADDERDDDSKKEDGDDDADDKRDEDADSDEEDDSDEKDDKRALTAAEVRKAAETAVRADRIRGAKIREIASGFGLPKLGERHVNDGTSVRKFKELVLERLANRQRKTGKPTFAASGDRGVEDVPGSRNSGAVGSHRDFEKGAAEARALLGK